LPDAYKTRCNTPALVDLDLASGLPKTIRVKTNDEEGFFYDNSALANGLIRAISRQISLCIFTQNTPQLKHLFDYNYSQEYGFPYSDELYKNIQTLVAMEMLNEDIRTFERKSTWKQRYEYTLTPSGATYAEEITDHYKKETELVTEYLKQHKHAIKHDLIKIPKERYQI